MKHVCSFSSGLSSAVMTDRVLARYGGDGVAIVFCDTLAEDEDNYRFMDECADRWRRLYGAEITTLAEGRTPLEVAADERIVPNQKLAPCTRVLKIEPFMKWLQQHQGAVVYIGIDYGEVHRCDAIRRNYTAAGYAVDFPLLWRPLEMRPYRDIVRDWGIEPPRTYAMGFSHANCLSHGCVKMGQSDWLRLLEWFPERYARSERWEREQRAAINADYAIVRDFTGGTVTPMTLERLRVERGASEPTLFDALSSCVHCGVGDYAPQFGATGERHAAEGGAS